MCLIQKIVVLYLVFFISSCGGGSSSDDGSENTKLSVSLSVQQLEEKVFKYPDNIKHSGFTIEMQVNYNGKTLIIGYPPDVSGGDWLFLSENTNTNTGHVEFYFDSYDLDVGTYSTTVRFAVENSLGTNVEFVDLPVSISVEDTPSITPSVIEISSTINQINSFDNVLLEIGGASSPLELSVYQPLVDNWVLGNANGKELMLEVDESLPPGAYNTSLKLNYKLDGRTGFHLMPVSYQVLGDVISPEIVAPASVIQNLKNQKMVISGSGFDSEHIKAIKVGDTEVQSFSVINDFSISFTMPIQSTLADVSISIETDTGSYPTENTISIIPSQPLPAGVIDIDGRIEHFVYSEKQQAIYVLTPNQLSKVSLNNNGWSIENSISTSWVESFDLTADQNQLVYSIDGNTIVYLAADTLTEVERISFPHYSDSAESHFDLEQLDSVNVSHVLNDGTVVFRAFNYPTTGSWIAQFLPVEGIYTYRPKSKTSSYAIGETRDSTSTQQKDKVLIVGNCGSCWSWEEYYAGIYTSSTGLFFKAPFNTDTISGNGEVIIEGKNVYDSSYSFLDVNIYSPGHIISYDGTSTYKFNHANFNTVNTISKYSLISGELWNTPVNNILYDVGGMKLSLDERTAFIETGSNSFISPSQLFVVPLP